MTTTAPGGTMTPAVDLTLSRMGFGAMQLAGPGVFGPPATDEAIAVLREAAGRGITHIDTADFYGPHITNQLIREALHPYPAGLHIVTKVGAVRDDAGGSIRAGACAAACPGPGQPAQPRRGRARRGQPAGGRRGRRPLRGAGLDRRQIRRAGGAAAGGLIRHLGLSTVDADQVAEAQSIAPVVTVQNFYNVAHRGDDALVDLLPRRASPTCRTSRSAGSRRCSPTPGPGRRPARRHAPGSRAGLAAAAFPHHRADPGDLVGGATYGRTSPRPTWCSATTW